MPRVPRPILIALLAAAALSAGPGCQRFRDRWKARFNPPEPTTDAIIAAPIPPGAEPARHDPGLEVAVWTVDDPRFTAARLLAPYIHNAVPMPEQDRAAWRALGLRLIAVPTTQIDPLLLASRPITPVQRQRFGQLFSWTPIARGPAIPEGVPAPLGPLPAGRPRLIARSWIEPDLSSGRLVQTVRTELAIQIESDRPALPSLERFGEPRSIADAGDILQTSITSLLADGSQAFVIVGEDPDIAFDRLPEIAPRPQPVPAAPPGPSGSDAQGQPTDTAPAGNPPQQPAQTPATGAPEIPLGPVPPRVRTIGERMLSSPGVPPRRGRAGQPPRKVFLVLIPRPALPTPLPGPAAP